MKTIFLGWTEPLCKTVPASILDALPVGEANNLLDTFIVVPTRQAGYRLRAALPLAAEVRGIALLGAEIKTASVLLAPPPSPSLANPAQVLAAWNEVLAAVKPGECEAFLGKNGSRTDGVGRRLQIARRLEKLRSELSDGGWSVTDVARKDDKFEEAARWTDMAELESRFFDCLRSMSLTDPVSARIENAESGSAPEDLRRVILAANPDPPNLLRTLLANWEKQGVAVEVLIGAPAADSAFFDAWGRPDPKAWATREIVIDDMDILLESTPKGQADRIVAAVSESVKKRNPGDRAKPSLAIGVPDRETIAPLQLALAGIGLDAFDPQKRPFRATPLGRLVQLLLKLAAPSSVDYATVSALLRHPVVARRLSVKTLTQLDAYQSEHIPVALDDIRPSEKAKLNSTPEHTVDYTKLQTAITKIRDWAGTLRSKSLPDALREILSDILQDDAPADQDFEAAATTFSKLLSEFETGPALHSPAATATDILAARLSDSSIEPERRGEQIDLEGWLELAWNPAPVLFVAGMNEGFVPDGTVGDVFLPDGLRSRLGLRDDSARLARDAFVLSAVLAQRKAAGRVVLLLGKTSTGGDPLRPSRLLFRCPDRELVGRTKRLFADAPAQQAAAPFFISFKLDPSRLAPADIHPKRRTELSPSSINDYLDSPLLFYFKHVLKMEKRDDLRRELDVMQFGNLIHFAVEDMGKDPGKIWACGDPKHLAAFLADRVANYCDKIFGRKPWLGITVAKESAIRRLSAFAQKQVAWHEVGWEIVETEASKVIPIIDGMTVKGRCDRIDFNSITKEYCVLDYKTGKTEKPEKKHLGGAKDEFMLFDEMRVDVMDDKGKIKPKAWFGLQLPLYRAFLADEGKPNAQIGYVNLPESAEGTEFSTWENYTAELHTSAMKCAQKVAEQIRDGVFHQIGRAKYKNDFNGLLLDDPAAAIVPPTNPWELLK